MILFSLVSMLFDINRFQRSWLTLLTRVLKYIFVEHNKSSLYRADILKCWRAFNAMLDATHSVSKKKNIKLLFFKNKLEFLFFAQGVHNLLKWMNSIHIKLSAFRVRSFPDLLRVYCILLYSNMLVIEIDFKWKMQRRIKTFTGSKTFLNRKNSWSLYTVIDSFKVIGLACEIHYCCAP